VRTFLKFIFSGTIAANVWALGEVAEAEFSLTRIYANLLFAYPSILGRHANFWYVLYFTIHLVINAFFAFICITIYANCICKKKAAQRLLLIVAKAVRLISRSRVPTSYAFIVYTCGPQQSFFVTDSKWY